MAKSTSRIRRNYTILLAAAAASAGLITSSPAANVTWDGGANEDALWSRPLNWDTNLLPNPNDSLFFGGFTRLSTSNDLTVATAYNGITFNATAGAFTLAGNSITLNGDVTDNTTLLTQNLNLALVLNATRTISVVDQGLLSIGGIISGTGFGVNKTGLGTATLSGANTFTGPINISGGVLAVSAANNLGGGTATGNLTLNGARLRANGNFAIPSSRSILLGPPGGSGSGTIDVTSGNTITFSGKIADNAGGTGTLNKIKFGNLTLGSTNTYTGATNVRNGSLILNFADANAPVTNIINPASNLVLGGDTAGLGTTNNATLSATAKAATANIQSFASTNIDIYGSVITATNSGTTGTMKINLGALTHTVGGTVVIPTNSGIVNTTTPVALTNGILGGWAIAGTPNVQRVITMGTDFATVDGSGNIIPYTGYVAAPVTDGTTTTAWNTNPGIVANADKNLKFIVPAANSNYRVDAENANTTTDINTLNFDTAGFNNSVLTIGTGNTLRFGKYGAIFKSTVGNSQIFIGGTGGGTFTPGVTANAGNITAGGPTLNTPGEIVVGLNEAANNSGGITIVSNIVDNGTGAVTLIKNSVASAKVDGHSTYSGGTYINQGRFQLAGSEQLLDGTGQTIGNPDGLGTGPVFVAPGAYLFISGVNGNGQYTGPGAIPGAYFRGIVTTAPGSAAQNAPMYNNMVLSGNGTNQEAGGSIRFGNRSILFGNITLAGDTRLFGGNAQAYPKINLDGTSLYFDPGNQIAGEITGNFNLDFGGRAVAGLNMMLSNTGNDWGGKTTLLATNGNTRIRLGANEVIPDGVGKGNVVMGENTGAFTGVLDMQGYNETINGLSTEGGTTLAQSFIENNGFTATVTDQGTNPKIYTYAGVTSTLTVGGFDQTASFGGIIRDNDPALTVTLPDPNGSTVTQVVTGPGVLAGSKMAITKIGSGVQTLSGANTYSGQTTINGGTLSVTGSLNSTGTVVVNAGGTLGGTGSVGSVTVNAGGHVAPGTSVGTINTANLTLNNADLAIEFGVGVSDLLNVAGSTTLTGAITITPGGNPSAGTYTILDSGANIIYGTSLTLGAFANLPDTRPASGVLDTTSELDKIKVIVTGGAKLLTWTGTNGSVWDKGTTGTVNWQDTTPSPEKFFNADGVTFPSGPTNRSITLNLQVSPGSITFTNDALSDYSIGGTGGIAGLGGITANGAGTATITTNNTFTGPIVVNSGKVVLKGSNGTLATTTVNGGILEIADGGSVGGQIDLFGVLQLNSDAGYTFSNAVAQAGEVRKIGTGLVTLAGNNTSAGFTTVNAGTLTVNQFTNRVGTGSVNVNAGGAFDLVGIGTANVAGGFGARTFNIAGAGPTGAGALVDTGLAQQNAFQSVTLGADATVGGTARWDLRGGAAQLDLGNFTLTKVGTNQISIVAGFITNGSIIVNAGTFSIETSTIASVGSGTFTYNAGSTAQFFQNSGDVTRPMIFNGNTVTNNSTATAGTVGSDITLNANIPFTIGGAALNFTGTISGTGGISKSLTGVLNLANATTTGNTFTGGTTVSAGTLQVGNINSLPGNVVNDALLQVNANNVMGNVDGGGTTTLGDGATGVVVLSNHYRQASLNVAANSTAVINPSSLAAGVSRLGNLTVGAGAKLNVNDNKVIVVAPNSTGSWDGTNYTGVSGLIASGRGTGNFWDGTTGIITTQTQAVGSNFTSIGVAKASDVIPATATATAVWAGQTVTGTDTLVMYTYGGDATLDGKINIDDYVKIDSGIASGLTGWVNGDFNYDGKINIDDYTTVIDANIGNQNGFVFPTSSGIGGSGPSGVGAVPEPAALTCLLTAASTLLCRRRRR